MMTTLPDYHLSNTLYQGTRTLVYRGTRTSDNQPVVIKFLRNEYPTFSELVQFRNQYTIAKNLDLPGIVKPLSLETHGNGYALVMPDEGYISLGKWQQGQFSMVDFLTIALQLAEILHRLSQNRVIHKDIKPANILIHPDTKQVKLIDFSISSLLPKETQEISNPNVLEGTLAYISPEQTGRMNRGIDYRTDFYSLGVTFYELLTGELPFQSDDPMELVHCHIAKSPIFPERGRGGEGEMGRKEIPQVLSNLVMKLMAKNAEDRYQSALGLKYDLEQCLTQWKETGKIEWFELGTRDICDRFSIPETLYGRETEVQTLLDAFERVTQGNSEMMLVAGFSGIGKTAVVNEVHKPIVRQRGYFIKGKYDQFNRNIPFSAFVQAFRNLMGQLLGDNDAQLAVWKTKILEALGENGRVIIEVIPELESIVGKQPEVPELSGSAAQNRFNLLFQKFVQVFAQPEHPLTLFLDDLQWADSASLELLKLLMNEAGYLLILGAYRDNEVSPAHPFMLTVHDIIKSGAIANTITLQSLSVEDTNRLIADTLNCDREIARPLTEIVDRKTQGNPFFTTQFLKALYQDKTIAFDRERGYWQCDITRVQELALTDDVVEFMALQLQKLPTETQAVLKLAACIGAQFDLQTLSVVAEQTRTEVAVALWKALQEGLILPITKTYKFFQDAASEAPEQVINVPYKFLHDRVQQAAYSLIPEDQKQATHYQIGHLWLNNTPAIELDETLFEIVNQLNIGKSLAIAPSQKIKLAELNLKAAQKARTATAYAAAYQYTTTGIDLINSSQLERSGWQSHYDIALPLYELAAETAYLNGDMTHMEKWAEIVLQQAKNAVDKMDIYATKIQAYMAQAKKLEALKMGLEALKLLGVIFPESPTPTDIEQALTQTASNLQGKVIGDLINLPVMTDTEKLAVAKMLASVGPPTYQAAPIVFPLVICELVNLSFKYGNSPFSGYGYACYGIFLNAIFQDPDSGYKFGQLALNLSQRFNAPDMKSSAFMAVGVCTTHIKVHVKETLPILEKGYQSGLEGGNFEFPAYCIANKCQYLYLMGQELSLVEREMETISDALARFKQDNALAWNRTFQQSVMNLQYPSENTSNLEGALYNEKISLPQLNEADHRSEIYFIYFNKLILSYLFENYQQAHENALKAKQYLDAVQGILVTFAFNFYDSLAHLAIYRSTSESRLERVMERVIKNQEKMKQWATHAPMNFQHKYDLVEAERYRISDDKLEAIELYDRAIAGARINEYIQEEALANELAAKFYLDWGKEKVAAGYMQEAYYCYARWGAKAKTDDLERRYPNLLRPILQAAVQTLNPINTLTTLVGFNRSLKTTTQTSHSSSSSINTTLDFAAILKASQALSSTIQLDELLRQLTHIILQNAGGDRCALILPESDGKWYVAAIATPEATELCSEPLQDNPRLPVRLIQYVKNTQETVVINDLNTDLPVIDDYLQQRQPKSLLCLPIFDRGNAIGILYLKNRSTSGAFTSERILILNFLCTQAAISIENARLYENAQAANKMLQKSLEDLKQAQLQLVQSEKMSALGNLVAGVAHEINNPVGFIGGNIQPARDYVQDLLGLIDLYQEKLPHPDEELEEELVAIDLDFIREDLPKLIDSMKLGVDRISHISTSLRTFSRTDKEHKVPFNLHDGIDSTLLILKHRLKANEQRPAIEIVKEYGKIPDVRCFPGQLNQVFINLIANAIDALDEGNRGRSFEEIAANLDRITIRTSTTSEAVTIRISDNGVGMPAEVQKRIFEQGFTTKGVGKGTGLGMAIARQIIEEKHGGTISCTSEPGKGTQFAIAFPMG